MIDTAFIDRTTDLSSQIKRLRQESELIKRYDNIVYAKKSIDNIKKVNGELYIKILSTNFEEPKSFWNSIIHSDIIYKMLTVILEEYIDKLHKDFEDFNKAE